MERKFRQERNVNNKLEQVFCSKNKDLSLRIREVIESTISFSGHCKNYCVCMVDVNNSTYTTARLTNGKACKYYSIFLNSMATIAEEFGAQIVKNVGDSLLYYFRETDSHDKNAFVAALECGIEMIEQRDLINTKMLEEGLPTLSYRISADYGTVLIARSVSSYNDDIFGSPVNMCTKMNSVAPPNTMIIGGDLHQIVKSFNGYNFNFVTGCNLGFQYTYPTYTVTRSKEMVRF